ncbi:NADH-quinone oxidoreductase subunit L [Fimbriiglobus ruber]|uniref:NADH-ubiquinone oxidoreductase chain L n=1 Tax=Fimbriiglobus ruber TaxID=1908690 RepID=A0A225DVJ5_9BACT|nr:NADH-quinone oxidoreductase subunit L [Fimbriiglobus ruber]OWK41656.1 NADH-ubiquinone oxidoreductase chain L [Fimbriiglobus ruber]
MSDPTGYALVALLLPLAAAIVAALMGAAGHKIAHYAHVPTVLAFAGSAVFALLGLVKVAGAEGEQIAFTLPALSYDPAYIWFGAGSFDVSFSITVDPLSSIMLATITFVATWIAIFSASYMHGDEGYARYFSVMSLFVFAMCLLVLANNFFLLVAGWEGVGLCSYLLVGYYYAKPSAAAAARKAFLVTRLGDVGLILGIFLLWQTGNYHTNLNDLFKYIADHPETHHRMTAACLLLFCGAVGKSAQLPLYVWLPDAMEGPTPVSALIHAATMVTAGVYLLARCSPLFVLAPDAQLVVSLIGGATALLAAFIAVAQTDLKRVLAYSTVSQLGFMFMALGCGGQVAPSLAVTAAIFHLFTHAFFKALLFLGSGSVMHAMGNVIDMRRFGGLRKVMPVTHLTFLAGAAALAGFPLLSGFWSKDQILDSLYEAAEAHGPNHDVYWIVLAVAVVTAGLTAFYTFRAYFLTFFGEVKIPEEAHGHAHESPWGMLIPLIVLAVGAVGAGAVAEPLGHSFSGFLAKTPAILKANELARNIPGGAREVEPPTPHLNLTVAAVSTIVALAGIGLAWRLYGKGGPEHVPAGLTGVFNLSRNKLYVDEVYAAALVRPAEGLATAGRQFDVLVSWLAELISFVPRFVGAVLRPLQNGLVQFYALGMVLGLAVYVTVIVFRSTR